MYMDRATIEVRAGKGGDGSVSFHREKYVPDGGPDGGDGGRGGNIYLIVDDNMATLYEFSRKRKFAAQNGANGSSRQKSGLAGDHITIKVPRGTLVRDCESGALLADMSGSEPFLLCKGGRGGWGNQHFATSTRQAPRFAKSGAAGESRTVLLELKLIADVGLVGFPNVGKSSLLAVISAARPKIADYHFTTLSPNLGVVRVDVDNTFVCADIPGLISGAAEGAGLGHEFLRHVDRCRLLVHVVDVSGIEGRDPCADFDQINLELVEYSPELAARPQIVAANKCDLLDGGEAIERLRAHVDPYPLLEISAATTAGVRELVDAVARELATLPPVKVYEPDPIVVSPFANEKKTDIKREDGVWIVEGDWIVRLMADINFDDYESRMYFDRCLRAAKVFDILEEMGVQDGDTVSLYGFEFDYVK